LALLPGDIAQHPGMAPGGVENPREHLDGGRLARSVRADEGTGSPASMLKLTPLTAVTR
jgi:hypothetical protein